MVVFNNTKKSERFNQNEIFILCKTPRYIESISESIGRAGLKCEKYDLTGPQVFRQKTMLLIERKLATKIEVEYFKNDIKPFHFIFSFSSDDDMSKSNNEKIDHIHVEEILEGDKIGFLDTDGHLNLPIEDNDLHAMIMLCTQKSYYEEIISDIEIKYKALEKISSLGQFTGSIIHDLNNYNTICMSALEGIKLLNKTEYNDEKLEFFSSRGLKGCKMINSISSKYRKFMFVSENSDKNYFSLNNLILEAMSFCEQDLNKYNITWKLEISKAMNIFCNEVSLIQIFINLISNSIYEIKEMDSPWISIKAKAKKHGIILYVIDCGKGIPREIQDKIFNPLFSTKKKSEGTGFGLSFCKEELLKMDIKLRYVESENTVFAIDIPTSLVQIND